MSTRIPDNIRLLGLIVKTIPHTHMDGVVRADYSAACEIDELKSLRTSIQVCIDSLPDNAPDHEKNELNDDLYFINNVILDLETHNQ